MRLGDVYVGLDRLRDAREQYESVLTALPAAAHQGLGEVALRERRYREALEHFRAALDRVPQATALHYSIAMAYRGLGRLDEARAHLARRGTGGIVAADPVVDSLQSLVRGERLLVIQGNRFYAAGRYQEAADAFERALAVAPSSVPARVNLASRCSSAATPRERSSTSTPRSRSDWRARDRPPARLRAAQAGEPRRGDNVLLSM